MRAGPLLMGRHVVGVPVAAALLVIVAVLSLRYGALDIDTATVWNALWDYDRGDHAQIVVRELRLHRTIIGVIAGASFAVAGALTQGVTRNPLGAPGILGTNAGAAFAVVTAIYIAGIATPTGYVWFAFAGALGATVLVYAIASAGAGGASPVKLALAGACLALSGALFQSLIDNPLVSPDIIGIDTGAAAAAVTILAAGHQRRPAGAGRDRRQCAAERSDHLHARAVPDRAGQRSGPLAGSRASLTHTSD